MRYRSFSVFDDKAKAFLPPFFCGEVGQASRMFSDLVNTEGHQFAKHPEDYVLYEIGLFDDGKALLEPFGPELIVTGLQAHAESTVIPDSQASLFKVGGTD